MLEDAVKLKLNITYSEPDTDTRINHIMEQADAVLRDAIGIDDASFDFETPGQEQTLFLAWCFYEYNDALDDFYVNYAEQMAQARNRWMVKQFVKEQEAADV